MVSDIARADIAMTPNRTYYRFATDSCVDQGEIRAIQDFERFAEDFFIQAEPKAGEASLPEDVKIRIFSENRIVNVNHTEESLKRIVELLIPLSEEFIFLKGFIS